MVSRSTSAAASVSDGCWCYFDGNNLSLDRPKRRVSNRKAFIGIYFVSLSE